jgi:acetyl-CoA acetyltransferase
VLKESAHAYSSLLDITLGSNYNLRSLPFEALITMNINELNYPVILSAARTPIGRMQSTLSTIPAAELMTSAVRATVKRAALPDPSAVDEVLIGNVVSAGLGQNIARQAAILGGLPATVGASTINKVCGASLKAVSGWRW